ncbi:uncharacterized protein LOC130450708 [Diorhabda sublineata]|uniref:uncharacterized protein LOC130450708 n=1 Tax=Diorhabda sublineata TaxID=1163346 RepID=UPI0024E0F937|nr:uncharacterized protein LOC130450708 [Diorhabda sublineata]
MMCRILLFILLLCSIKCQESSLYLQTAVRDLRRMNYRQTLRRADTLITKSTPRQETPPSEGVVIPPLSLTKGELAALYESAIAKGETLKLDTGDNGYLHAAVHELDHEMSDSNHEHPPGGEESKHEDGYYYYYYPVKSFMDEMASGSSTREESKPWKYSTTTHRPPYQYHSHHHEVTIKKESEPKENKEKKGLEPLFMAISGFVGMAVMFVISMLILPKFENKKPKKASLWHKNEDMDELARLALNAIEGKDCRERFACELRKTARNFNLQDNRFIKLLKRIAPGTFGSQLDRISKYGDRQLQCTLIPCTKRVVKIQKTNVKKTPVKKKNVAQKKN